MTNHPNAAPGHTPEPWYARDTQVTGDGILIAGFIGRAANATRIVQCVNALAGIPNPARFVSLVRDAVQAGAVDEVYLGLIREAMGGQETP